MLIYQPQTPKDADVTHKTVDVPSVSRVPVSLLNIDPGYQREAKEVKLRHLRNKWSWVRFSPLKVSRRVGGERAGELFIWDGQHRYLVAAELFGETQVIPCIVTPMTYEQEADAFARQDEGSTSVTTAAKFKALLEARDPVATDIEKIAHEHGFFIAANKALNTSGTALTGPATLISIYNADGRERLALILTIINAAWPPGVRDRNASWILAGLAHFIRSYPEADIKRLTRKLSEPGATPSRIAQNSTVYGGTTGGRSAQMSRTILDIYNKGLHGNHLEWMSNRAKAVRATKGRGRKVASPS